MNVKYIIMKKFILLFLLLIFIGCSSADLYQFNYSNDPDMQERMEKQYGDIPFWQDQGK